MPVSARIPRFHAQPPAQQPSADLLPSEEETILRREKTAEQHSKEKGLCQQIKGSGQYQQDHFHLVKGLTIKVMLMTDHSDRITMCIVQMCTPK